MVKNKKKSTRSIGSSNSKSSNSTNPASNVSSSSSSSTVVSGKDKTKNRSPSSRNSKRKSKAKITTSNLPPRTPPIDYNTPPRQRAQSEPVDLDNMVDKLNQSNEIGISLADISPAETFDTIPLSDSPSRDDQSVDNGYLPVSLLSFGSPRKGNGSKSIDNNGNANSSRVVIEHKMKDSSSNRGGSRSPFAMMCLMKPLLLVLFLLFALSGAASVYGWLFKFPSLNKQVQALEEQVSRLESENDRYENLNNRLNNTVDDLESVKDDLNGTVSELDDVASALNTTKDQIVEEIEELKGQNFEYSQLNEGLQDNVDQLAGELSYFREALDELSNEHLILQTTTASLQDLAAQFTNTTIDQNETLAILKETLEGFQAENDRLEDFNEKLETGLNYLNETLFANGNLVESSAVTLGEITEVLGERVKQQQQATLVQLEISYRQLLAGWDCDYKDVFGPSVDNYGSVLSSQEKQLPAEVQTYVDDRVLSKLCLDFQDFENYMFSSLEVGTTSNELIRAVVLYTEDAMRYYFPSLTSDGSTTAGIGVSLSEWIDASFRCDLLESPYVSSSVPGGVGVRRGKQLFHLRY